ncbi:DNA topoisomerase I [Gammaproteobacteria bacterium]|jgi:DNA topoisomerase I|nr:DNA topoisomerase I [Gammaproteobacteria bacterium]
MSSSLVIVESPAKCKTLERYLGKDFKVLASYGHVRDLLPKTGAVDPENNFSMRYEAIEKNAKAVTAISKALKKADTLYLATDPDREGEAISWHLHELLKEKGELKNKLVHRVVFHEVTKSAVQDAIKNPRELASNLIDSQQARRALDYLVGFNLSPLLWKKIQRGLSAGRVQSPALRMIAEREKEIQAFEPREYWTIEADLEHKKNNFSGKLTQYKNEKIKQFTIEKTQHAAEIKATLDKAASGELLVETVIKKQRKRQPAAPFITSTLQQEAVRKLGFTAQRAMRTAQQLYEGIDVGEGAVGLITYMRTDSINLAQEAIIEIRELISARYGKQSLPSEPRVFKTKSKNAQEAHEAVRPTSITRAPQDIRDSLTSEQFKLYELIWKRTMASQMTNAIIDTVAVDMSCGDGNLLRSNGSAIADEGFMAVYLEGKDDSQGGDDEKMLPQMKEGDKIKLKEIRDEQHFTEPPPRYSEASLVKSLEEYGIGRPSTYANIISTLRNREYVELENKRFHPTDVGKIVNDFLTKHFKDYVDYEFTAKLEDDLDAISRGEKEWIPLLQEFWTPFHTQVLDKDENVSRSEVAQARVLGPHPKTGKEVSVRIGRYGPYAQIGTKDDEDKPKFAGLRPGQKLDSITFEEALELFKLPRILGETKEGEEIAASVGRFGAYIRYGSKFVSLPKEEDPYIVTLEQALELVIEKKKADAEKQIKIFVEEGISILNGRYGPYITDGTKNAKIPKDTEPATLELEECLNLLAAAPVSRSRGRKKATAKKKVNKKNMTKKKVVKKKASKKSSTKKTASRTS